jgi:diguanylate cyclase (GGDEF)-like protein
MLPADALSMFFGSALIIIIIFAEFYGEYVNGYSFGQAQKKSFFLALIVSFLFLAVDILFSLIKGLPYFLSLSINILTAILVICILIVFRKTYKQILLLTVFVILYMFGLFADIVTGSTKLVWPFISALLLYTYFAIIQSETKQDHLTGLGNRYSFFEFIDELSRHKAEESWIVVMIDIDGIRAINNTYGHLEGDIALKQLAQVIKTCTRKTDFASRYGGDEFILSTKVEYGIEDLLKKIKDELVMYNEKSQKPYKLSISYGFDVYNAGRSIEEFINHLDELTKKHKIDLRRTGDGKTGEKA